MCGVDDEDPVEDLRRKLPAQRSMIAFARGAWTGVLMIRLPSAWNTASKAPVELGIPVADSEPELAGLVAEVEQEITRLLGDPRGGWLGGDAEHVDRAGGVLYDGEAVQPCQRDGVGVKEVFKPRLAPITYGGARRTARGSTICNNDLGKAPG